MNKLLSTLLLSLTSMYASAQTPSLITDFGYQPYATEGRVSFFTHREYGAGTKYKNGAIEIHIVSVKCKEMLYRAELQVLILEDKEPKIIDTATNALLSKKYTPIPKDLLKLADDVCKTYN